MSCATKTTCASRISSKCTETESAGVEMVVDSSELLQVEPETRPDFKKLKAIEKTRREILYRVSIVDVLQSFFQRK